MLCLLANREVSERGRWGEGGVVEERGGEARGEGGTLLGVADHHQLLASVTTPVDGDHLLPHVLLHGDDLLGEEHRRLWRGGGGDGGGRREEEGGEGVGEEE